MMVERIKARRQGEVAEDLPRRQWIRDGMESGRKKKLQ